MKHSNVPLCGVDLYEQEQQLCQNEIYSVIGDMYGIEPEQVREEMMMVYEYYNTQRMPELTMDANKIWYYSNILSIMMTETGFNYLIEHSIDTAFACRIIQKMLYNHNELNRIELFKRIHSRIVEQTEMYEQLHETEWVN